MYTHLIFDMKFFVSFIVLFFLLQSSIMKKNPRKFGRTVDEGEMVEFDLVESTKVPCMGQHLASIPSYLLSTMTFDAIC